MREPTIKEYVASQWPAWFAKHNRAVDDLPYTKAFDAIHKDLNHHMGTMTQRECWKLLITCRKDGICKAPRQRQDLMF